MPELTPRLLIRKAERAEREAAKMETVAERHRKLSATATATAAGLRRSAQALRAGAAAMVASGRAHAVRTEAGMESTEPRPRHAGRPAEKRTRLREAMEAVDLSTPALATRIKRKYNTVLAWVSGSRKPPADVQKLIREVLPDLPADAF